MRLTLAGVILVCLIIPVSAVSQCVAGFYNTQSGINCTACPANSDSLANSTSEQNCSCNAGYELDADANTRVCKPCDAGFYGAVDAFPGYYQPHPGHFFLGFHGVLNDNDFVSLHEADLVAECDARSDCYGWTGVLSWSQDALEPARKNENWLLLNTTKIYLEDPSYFNFEAGWHESHDFNGRFRTFAKCSTMQACEESPHGINCKVCPKNSRSSMMCERCPEHSSSPSGSAFFKNCTCNAGYEFGPQRTIASRNCEQCNSGYYKTDEGIHCLACPANSDSPRGSTSEQDCSCNAGYELNQDADTRVCKQCIAGTYKTQGEINCIACPANSHALAGSTSEQNCTCNANFVKDHQTTASVACVKCPAGKYAWPGSECRPEFDTCWRCDPNVCPVGTFLSANCSACMPCTRTQTSAHWKFVTVGEVNDSMSCDMACDDGFFADGNTCVPHSSLECLDSEFLLMGSSLFDAQCVQCRTCEGLNRTKPCSANANAVCEKCAHQPFAVFRHSNCTVECMQNYVWNVAVRACQLCVDFQCAPGTHTPTSRHNCTHCEPCGELAPNAVFVDACVWRCNAGFEWNSTDSKCQKMPDVHTPQTKTLYNISCGQSARLNAAYECEPCDVHTPNPAEEGRSWAWTPYGPPCRWECMVNFFVYTRESDVSVHAPRCLQWKEYQAAVQSSQVFDSILQNMQDETSLTSMKKAKKQDKLKLTWQNTVVMSLSVLLSILLFRIQPD